MIETLKIYLPPFLISAIISGGLTYSIKKLAERFKLLDRLSPRKIHAKPIPRLGGVAFVLTFIFLTIGYNLITPRLNFTEHFIWHVDKHIFGVMIGALILLIVGIFDDIYGIVPWKKLFWHFIAAITVVAFGLGIDYIRIPGGGLLDLRSWIIPINIFGHGFQFVVWSDLLTVFWIVLLINTLNFLDGLDGLASGISIIAGGAIFFLALSLGQPGVALLALLFAGSVLGFLPWNFNPAKIFMGDSGSMFLGYMLGVLSVIAGGKLATAFLILGIPVLDVGWVIIRRIFHRRSPFQADLQHLHHRFLTAGFSQRQAVIILYLITILFGIVAVSFGTQQKIQAVWWLFGLMAALVISLVIIEWRRRVRRIENHE